MSDRETAAVAYRRNHRKRRQSEVLRLLHKTLPASRRSKDRLDLENLPADET